MVNEGIVVNDTKALVKSEMVKQLARLQQTTPDEWERAVFEGITGHKREDVDWNFEDNQAGFYTWIKSFDRLIEELADDGYVTVKNLGENKKVLIANEVDGPIDYSHFAYPPQAKAH